MSYLILVFSLFAIPFFAFLSDAQAWLEPTHEIISAAAISASKTNTEDRFKDLGFTQGLEERLRLNEKQEETVLEWLKNGAILEDDAILPEYVGVPRSARSTNHFHNPQQ